MLMPDVTMLLTDPTLGAQPITITRKHGSWSGGRFTLEGEAETFRITGILQPPSPEQLEFFPEGEKREGQVVVYTKTHLYLTEGDMVSDVVTWRGEDYKIVNINRWQDYGFNIAYAQKR